MRNKLNVLHRPEQNRVIYYKNYINYTVMIVSVVSVFNLYF